MFLSVRRFTTGAIPFARKLKLRWVLGNSNLDLIYIPASGAKASWFIWKYIKPINILRLSFLLLA